MRRILTIPGPIAGTDQATVAVETVRRTRTKPTPLPAHPLAQSIGALFGNAPAPIKRNYFDKTLRVETKILQWMKPDAHGNWIPKESQTTTHASRSGSSVYGPEIREGESQNGPR